MEFKHGEATDRVLKAFHTVYHSQGYGFLEKVTENSMAIELRKAHMTLQQQFPISVYFDGQIVGEYYADLVVDGLVIVEIKAVRRLLPEHEAQLLNYLKATPYEVGLLLNFGPKPEIKRKVYDNWRKPNLRALEDEESNP
jgi:GxxExxY protein